MIASQDNDDSGLLLVSQFVNIFREDMKKKWSLLLTEELPESIGGEKVVPTRLSVIRHITKGIGRRGGTSGGLQVQYLYKNAGPTLMNDVSRTLSTLGEREPDWADSEVIRVEDAMTLSGSTMDSAGVMYLAVFFKGYKDNYQNDSRKSLLKSFPTFIKKHFEGAEITPLSFSLVYGALDCSGKAIGAQYQYAFRGLESAQIDAFTEAVDSFTRKAIWDSQVARVTF